MAAKRTNEGYVPQAVRSVPTYPRTTRNHLSNPAASGGAPLPRAAPAAAGEASAAAKGRAAAAAAGAGFLAALAFALIGVVHHVVVIPGPGCLPGVLVDLRLEVGVEPTELGGDLVGNAQEQGVDHIVLPDQRLLKRPLPDEGKVQQEVLQAQDLVQRLLALGCQAADAVAAHTLETALLHQDLHGVLLAGGQEPGQGDIVVLAEEGQLSGLEDAVSPGGRLQDGVEGIVIPCAVPGWTDQAEAGVFVFLAQSLLHRL